MAVEGTPWQDAATLQQVEVRDGGARVVKDRHSM